MKPAKKYPLLKAPECWENLPWGTHFKAGITQQIRPWLSKLYGMHLLKIGHLSIAIDTSGCGISHQVNVGLTGQNLTVQAHPEQLPVMSKSVDACLLTHVLAWSQDPHQIIRETDRVLVDDGWIILSEFNPVSVIGGSRLIPGRVHQCLKGSRFFSEARITDWLHLLNYEVLCHQRIVPMPWGTHKDNLLARHLPGLGCVSLLMARKRTYPLTPERRHAAAKLSRLQVVINATRQRSEMRDQEVLK